MSETDSEAALSRAGGWREKHSETNTHEKKKRETNDTITHNTTEDHIKNRLCSLILKLRGLSIFVGIWPRLHSTADTFTSLR